MTETATADSVDSRIKTGESFASPDLVVDQERAMQRN